MRAAAIGTAVAAGVLAAACGGSQATAGRSTTAAPPAVTTTTTSATPTVTATTSPSVVGPSGGAVPSGFEPASVTFVSASEGFVLGSTGCGSAGCLGVLRTTDGGAHWVGIPAPRTGLDNGVDTLRFLDARDGFAFGPELWATHDGGASWHEITVIPAQDKILGGEVAGDTLVLDVIGGAYRIAADSDTPQRLDAGSYADLAPAGATVVGYVQSSAGSAGSGQLVQVGASGQPRTFAGPSGASGYQYCPPAGSSSSDLVVVCTTQEAGGGMGSRAVWGSTDAGAHWTRLGDPGGGSGYATSGVAVTTTEHAVIATADAGGAGLSVSTDGGTHWSQVLHLASQGEGFSDLGFTTSTQGVAVFAGVSARGTDFGDSTRPALYLTHDGGQHWTKVSF